MKPLCHHSPTTQFQQGWQYFYQFWYLWPLAVSRKKVCFRTPHAAHSGSEPTLASNIEYDIELGESPLPGEEAATLAITENIEQAIKSRYIDNLPALRRVHTKAHGCVLADFQINKALRDEHQHGVFQPGARYRSLLVSAHSSAWVVWSARPEKPFTHEQMAKNLKTITSLESESDLL